MCERPKVNPHKEQMKANIARVLGLDVKQIGIKGTTTEKLGFGPRRRYRKPGCCDGPLYLIEFAARLYSRLGF
jgi:hypothetical protein